MRERPRNSKKKMRKKLSILKAAHYRTHA